MQEQLRVNTLGEERVTALVKDPTVANLQCGGLNSQPSDQLTTASNTQICLNVGFSVDAIAETYILWYFLASFSYLKCYCQLK